MEQPRSSHPSTPGCTNTPACSHFAHRCRLDCTPAPEQPPAAAGRCSAEPEGHPLWVVGSAAGAGSAWAGSAEADWALAAGSPWAQATRRWRRWQPGEEESNEALFPAAPRRERASFLTTCVHTARAQKRSERHGRHGRYGRRPARSAQKDVCARDKQSAASSAARHQRLHTTASGRTLAPVGRFQVRCSPGSGAGLQLVGGVGRG